MAKLKTNAAPEEPLGPVPGPAQGDERLPGELTARELLRWTWRQLTSMRTALVLLFLLALAAVPGSVIPQTSVDSYAVSQWKKDHTQLAPIYEKLGMFEVFSSPWFSAIYILLAVSLVGCILPRTKVYWRGFRAAPPAAPRNLTRLPDSSTYVTAEAPEVVLEKARAALRRKRYRVVVSGDAVSAERGYLREAGNLLFHIAVLVVLAGFAIGSLWGYKGGVIVTQGTQFSNTPTQYDDFTPGKLTKAGALDSFSLQLDRFDIEWLYSGPRKGMAHKFVAGLTWWDDKGTKKTYDLRVNHPLSIGGTDVFLIGHGYSPVITVRDGEGHVAYSGPTPFLPQEQRNFTSYGVVKVPDAKPKQIGLEGLFLPTYNGDPLNSAMGNDLNPLITMQAYVGDLGLNDGVPQSVYSLDTKHMKLLAKPGGKLFRVDLKPGESVDLPGGNGSVTFDGVQPWVRLEIAKKPGTMLALGGAILALTGLCGSLFIRPRRLWVRAIRRDDGETLVEVAGLDRSSGGDLSDDLTAFVAALQGSAATPDETAGAPGVQEDQ
ncbi:cytochrome c biogenesis protein ResB [Nocardioides jiangxiensis]|uniref:Cytochrome c biogenesis protein ResB n=1 Tax=Nocardioides jiangxiensis TaxID=3064524 RepID=A0ABT9B1J4_9ACTN|nr:cytochrome c biogenesis protein ResB [Nocardioides sp. WY-20]MDO7868597.1 cytochrome c biogenesis protein ResB [Nocardioides sp. WY-20]